MIYEKNHHFNSRKDCRWFNQIRGGDFFYLFLWCFRRLPYLFSLNYSLFAAADFSSLNCCCCCFRSQQLAMSLMTEGVVDFPTFEARSKWNRDRSLSNLEGRKRRKGKKGRWWKKTRISIFRNWREKWHLAAVDLNLIYCDVFISIVCHI